MIGESEHDHYIRQIKSQAANLGLIRESLDTLKREMEDDCGDASHASRRFLALATRELNSAADSLVQCLDHLPAVDFESEMRRRDALRKVSAW